MSDSEAARHVTNALEWLNDYCNEFQKRPYFVTEAIGDLFYALNELGEADRADPRVQLLAHVKAMIARGDSAETISEFIDWIDRPPKPETWEGRY